jgi:hypothetical protein
MAIESMQSMKQIPWMFYYPVLSRAKNIGVEGLNKAPDVILKGDVILSKRKTVDWNNFAYPFCHLIILIALTFNVTELQTMF